MLPNLVGFPTNSSLTDQLCPVGPILYQRSRLFTEKCNCSHEFLKNRLHLMFVHNHSFRGGYMNDNENLIPSSQVELISRFASLSLAHIGLNLLLYLVHYWSVALWCMVCPKNWCFRSREYLDYAKSPASLRRELRRDLNTLIQRMERRISALPNRELIRGLRVFEPGGSPEPRWNKKTLACMTDIEKFLTANPQATEFDDEIFRLGWSAGVESDYGTRRLDMAESRA
jgi:hypothetical protein